MTTAAQMGKKPPAPEFNHCIITIGYHRYLIPKRAALAFFEAMSGKEMYQLESWYDGEDSREVLEVISPERMPTLSIYSAVQFHIAKANAEVREEHQRKKKV